MEKGFLDKVEDNAAIQIWAETMHVTQNNLQEMKEIWDQWDDQIKAANVPTFLKKRMNITGVSEQWVIARVKQKGDSKCISWRNVRDFILAHPDVKKRIDISYLPLGFRHIDEAVSDLFNRLDKRVTPVPSILAETFRSLNACRRAGEGRFIACAQLLLAWFHSHFWKIEKVLYRILSENYSPLKELVTISRQDDITEEKWMMILQNLQNNDIEWGAPWMVCDEILYRCGDFDGVPLLEIWGAIGYAPLLVVRQYRSRQFLPATQGMKKFTANPMTTPEYDWWWGQRTNDNIPTSDQENTRSIEEHLQFENRLQEATEVNENRQTRKEIKKLWQEIKEEKSRANQWEKECQDAQVRGNSLERDLSKCQNEKIRLKAKVAELEKSLHQYRNHNSIIELKTSIKKIEELKRKIEELEIALQNRELRVELLEASNEQWKEQLHRSQGQVRD
ncbi:coiled-coil domain-containing protein 102A-like protein [Gossypium australe]|uniref:Coiled-coil domain-containing protein 102A-like protein n=1 Tax=Gossypium australe TaxID=47621 RepID=A0A5B6WKY3_9ROSI|nr:coiled-coil domain-containing protein 102A-like protein [Gossypium australe]